MPVFTVSGTRRTLKCAAHHGRSPTLADNISIKCCERKEYEMHKLFAVGFAIYLVGDPGLSMLASFSEAREWILASALAFIAVPWVVSQIDN